MKILERSFILQDDRVVLLRSSDIIDAEQLLDYFIKSAGETNYLGRYPEEIKFTLEDEKSYIERQLNSDRNFDIAAFIDGKIVGNATIFAVSGNLKTKHRAIFGISVLKDYWNMGIGNALTGYCLEKARDIGYEQVELEVVSVNKGARYLYEKHGFKTCGLIENAEKLKDGTYHDLQMMICKFV